MGQDASRPENRSRPTPAQPNVRQSPFRSLAEAQHQAAQDANASNATTGVRQVPQPDVARLLSQQRELYERKLREAEMAAQSSRTAVVDLARAATEKAIDEKVKAAKKVLDEKMNQQLLEMQQIMNRTSLSPQDAGPSTASQSSVLERNRSPYSLTARDLDQGSTNQTLSPQTTYPNLNKVSPSPLPTPSSMLHTPPSHQPSNVTNPNTRRESGFGDFVMVNSNLRAEVYDPTPSAPPASRPNQPAKPNRAQAFKNNKPHTTRVFSPRPNESKDGYCCSTCHIMYGLKSIFQCEAGHSSCLDCKQGRRLCGTCRANITDRRNFSLETMIAQSKVPCPNETDGCRGQWKLDRLDDHLKECPFRMLVCPVTSQFPCPWRGKLHQISSHVTDLHPESRRSVDTEMHLVNIVDSSHTKTLIEFDEGGPYQFLFHIKVNTDARKIFMAVQLFSTRSDANMWFYEIHFYNKREPRRKYLFTDVCQSNSTPVEEIFQEHKCASITTAYAMSFVNEGTLAYKVYIKKDSKAPESRGNQPASRDGGRRGRGMGRRKFTTPAS